MTIQELMAALNAAGVSTDRVLAALKCAAIENITPEQVTALTAHLATIKQDPASADRLFPKPAPAPAPAARGNKPAGNKSKNRPSQPPPKSAPFDQHPGFRKRVNQEAARLIRRELNCSIEEAKEIIAARAAGGDPATPPAPAAGGAPPTPQSESTRVKKLQEELAAAKQRIGRQHKQIIRGRDRKKADVTALEMKFEAMQAGISERYVNFAMSEYGELWTSYQANAAGLPPEIKKAFEADPINGRAIFAYILGQNSMIGAQPPTIVPLDPTTAPPASRQPGEETPPVKPPGAPPERFDAGKLTPEQWRAHKRKMGLGF